MNGLYREGFACGSIHGDRSQGQREQVFVFFNIEVFVIFKFHRLIKIKVKQSHWKLPLLRLHRNVLNISEEKKALFSGAGSVFRGPDKHSDGDCGPGSRAGHPGGEREQNPLWFGFVLIQKWYIIDFLNFVLIPQFVLFVLFWYNNW